MVHVSRGGLTPIGENLRSEVAIVCELAHELFGPRHPVPWQQFADDYDDYDATRDSIARVVPGFDDFNTRVRQSDGLALPHPPRDSRRFETHSSRASFIVNELRWLCPRWAADPSDDAQPRPVTATAASRTAAGYCSSTPPTSHRSDTPTSTSSTSSPSGHCPTADSKRAVLRLSGSLPTHPRSATSPPTTRKPTRSSHSTTLPTNPTSRCPRQWSSA